MVIDWICLLSSEEAACFECSLDDCDSKSPRCEIRVRFGERGFHKHTADAIVRGIITEPGSKGPDRRCKPVKVFGTQYETMAQAMTRFGHGSPKIARRRRQQGWDTEAAICAPAKWSLEQWQALTDEEKMRVAKTG